MDRFSFFRMLGEAVYRVDGAYDVVSKNIGVKPSILWLLSALNDGQKHSQNQLCWDWNYPRTTLNTLVKELEKKGHVVLNPVPGARRELYVELTEEGKAFADQVLLPREFVKIARAHARGQRLRKLARRLLRVKKALLHIHLERLL